MILNIVYIFGAQLKKNKVSNTKIDFFYFKNDTNMYML
jgi:hypothetical protein